LSALLRFHASTPFLAEVLARRSDSLLLLTATPDDGNDRAFASLCDPGGTVMSAEPTYRKLDPEHAGPFHNTSPGGAGSQTCAGLWQSSIRSEIRGHARISLIPVGRWG